jgi:hypothetical protein
MIYVLQKLKKYFLVMHYKPLTIKICIFVAKSKVFYKDKIFIFK